MFKKEDDMVEQFLIFPKKRHIKRDDDSSFENMVINLKKVLCISKPVFNDDIHIIRFHFDDHRHQDWVFESEAERDASFSRIVLLYALEM